MQIPLQTIYQICILGLLCCLMGCEGEKEGACQIRWTKSEFILPPENFIDASIGDKIYLEITNETGTEIRIPTGKNAQMRFRLIAGMDTVKLLTEEDGSYPFHAIPTHRIDTLRLSTRTDYLSTSDSVAMKMENAFRNGQIEACLPLDSAQCTWEKVIRSANYEIAKRQLN